MNVVICGGGIIGSSCAYYLATKNIACTIVEQEGIACAASGKAGGFLARNWCVGKKSNDLTKLSYNLHMDLAKIFTEVDYRCVNTHSISVNNSSSGSSARTTVLPWLNGPFTKHSVLDNDKNTAQVHPKKLCQKFVHEALRITDSRTNVIFDKVIGLEFDRSCGTPVITGVKLQSGSVIKTDKVLIAMGPWSHTAVDWFPKGVLPDISGVRAHSIVMKVPDNLSITADCFFINYRDETGTISPEVYPRPDGTVYLCGATDEKELPSKSSEIEVVKWRCDQLCKVANVICSGLESAEIVCEQACYLPMTGDDAPIIGMIGDVKGAYVATGHSCWGILQSTGTGYAMAELIATGHCNSLNLAPFDPRRFH